MPVLESTDRITPRSALRHRPIGAEGKSPVTTSGVPVTPRASRQRPRTADTQDEIAEWQRADGRVKAGSAQTARQKPPSGPLPRRSRLRVRPQHQLVFLGLGMLLMLVLWTVLSSVISWITVTIDDLHYGRPRTYQTDAYVGHNEAANVPSHFIALNLHGHIDIIEFPGGDESHAHVYLGPQLYGPGADLVPVTLRFVDFNADHRLDMVLQFPNDAGFSSSEMRQTVFINDHGAFRPMLPAERHQIERILQKAGS